MGLMSFVASTVYQFYKNSRALLTVSALLFISLWQYKFIFLYLSSITYCKYLLFRTHVPASQTIILKGKQHKKKRFYMNKLHKCIL